MGFLMHFRPFSVKKSDFFSISPIFEIFWPIFFDDLLNIGILPPPKTSDSPRVPHCRFILKISKKSEKKSDFRCRPPKTDFRFLMYTSKNIYFKNKNTIFFMYFCLSDTKIGGFIGEFRGGGEAYIKQIVKKISEKIWKICEIKKTDFFLLKMV